MAFQSVPNAALVSALFSANGGIAVMTFGYYRSIGYGEADLGGLVELFDAWVGASWLANVSNQVTYVQSDVRGLENENDFYMISNEETGVGAQNAAPLPANVAFAIKRLSNLTGRSARGRVYVPFIPINAQTANENVLDTGSVNAWVADLNELVGLAVGIGWQHVIISRFNSGEQRETGVVFPVVTYAVTDYQLDSRRDRLP